MLLPALFLLLSLSAACSPDAGVTRGQKKIDITVENESSREVVVDFGVGDRRILKKGDWEFARAFGVDSRTVCLYEAKREGVLVEAGKKITCRTFRNGENTWAFR